MEYLESSTIHGLSYISLTRRFQRLFWILVVITGFSSAGFLIYLSFANWEDNPISTTIETLSIDKVKFPKVTVCPPRDTFTNLNYDLVMKENLTLNNDTILELQEYALHLIHEAELEDFYSTFKIVDLDDKYQQWYQGLVVQKFPYFDVHGILTWSMQSPALKGQVVTIDFGKPFSRQNMIQKFQFKFHLTKPKLAVDVEVPLPVTLSVKKETTDDNELTLDGKPVRFNTGDNTFNRTIDKIAQLKKESSMSYKIYMTKEEVETLEVEKMLGFRLTWAYKETNIPLQPNWNENRNLRR